MSQKPALGNIAPGVGPNTSAAPEAGELTSAPADRQTFRMHESDRASVAKACDGDSEAFRSLVERHSRYVFNVAYRLTGSAQDAEDIVQDTFLKAYKQLSRFEARADFRTWLHRIAVNRSIDLIRTRRHKEFGQDPSDLERGGDAQPDRERLPGPDRLLLSTEIRERVNEGLGQLTASERLAFTLRHVEGLPIREVATAMGLKTEAAKNSIFRAVRKMRAALEPFVESPEATPAKGSTSRCI
jgi:RNA polymerase sigma-70 factor, ECF subfamily